MSAGTARAESLHTRKGERVTYIYRNAVPDDAVACVAIRGRTRENAISVARLMAMGITVDSWRGGIDDGSFPGHVCLHADEIIGYCFGAAHTGEIVVLALLPDHEGRGLGRVLLNKVVEDFKRIGHRRLFLGCSPDPAVRSYGFYRHEGWTSTGTLDSAGDEVLECFIA